MAPRVVELSWLSARGWLEGSDIYCTECGHLLFASTRKIVFVDRLYTQTFFGGLSKRIGCKDFSFPFRMIRTIYHWWMISSGNHQPIKKPVKIAVTTWHSLGAHCRPKFTTAAAEMVQTKQQFYLRTIFEQLTVKDFRRTPYFWKQSLNVNRLILELYT